MEGADDTVKNDVVYLFRAEVNCLLLFTAEQECAGGGLVELRYAVKDCRLACAVGADETENFAFLDVKAQSVYGLDTAEVSVPKYLMFYRLCSCPKNTLLVQ